MSKGIDRIVDIIQDNASYEQFLVNVSLFIDGKTDVIPPQLAVNNGVMDDIMSKISEVLVKARREGA